MNVVFYISAVVAVISTVMVITRLNIMHALLYLIVSLLSISVIFFTLGAPFVAALEVIVYAGAIMVLFIFAIMMLNLGVRTVTQEREWLKATSWTGPAVLALILFIEVAYVILTGAHGAGGNSVPPAEVGGTLFGPYLIGVELASFLLLAALVGARHIGQRVTSPSQAAAIPVEEEAAKPAPAAGTKESRSTPEPEIERRN
jgi:NADH-quinone oxidoreductase subunit J